MPYYNGDPKRDHNFDNHPNRFLAFAGDVINCTGRQSRAGSLPCPVLGETQVRAGYVACSPQSDSQRNGCSHNGAATGEIGDAVIGAAGAVLV